MYSDTDLEDAVTAGVLSAKDVQRFRDYLASASATPAVDEEHFRLLTGFNDIFVSIAAIILLVAMGWIGQSIHTVADESLPSPFAGAGVAAAAWGLAEFFTRKRRMALPSIILLLAFVGGIFETIAGVVVMFVPEEAMQDKEGLFIAACAAFAAGGAWLHWRRFRIPITVAAGAAAIVGLVLALTMSALGESITQDNHKTIMLGLALAMGIGVFLFAMWWDSSDLARRTRRSDIAFWLHLLSAPLIVHPVFSLLGLTDGSATTTGALIVLLVYVLLGLTALAIDRRALLVSALAYVLYALNDLFQQYGAVELSFALTALVIGSALLLLSAFWHNARRVIVQPLPIALQAKLPSLDKAG